MKYAYGFLAAAIIVAAAVGNAIIDLKYGPAFNEINKVSDIINSMKGA